MQIIGIRTSQVFIPTSFEKSRFAFSSPAKDVLHFSGRTTTERPIAQTLQSLSFIPGLFEPSSYRSVERDRLISRIQDAAIENEKKLSKVLDDLEEEKRLGHFSPDLLSSKPFVFASGRSVTINPSRDHAESCRIGFHDTNVYVHIHSAGLVRPYLTGLQLLCDEPSEFLDGKQRTTAEWDKIWKDFEPRGPIGQMAVENRVRVKRLLDVQE